MKLLILTLTLACLLCVAVAGNSMHRSRSSAVNNEDRQVLYERKKVPAEWRMVGFPQQTEQVRFFFALKQQNLDKLEKKFWAISTPGNAEYRNFMTTDEVLDLIAPPVANKQVVVDWLHSQGCSHVEDRRDALVVNASVATAEKIFQTKLYLFSHTQRKISITRQMGAYSLPRAILAYVDLVTGVSDFPALKRGVKRPVVDANVVPATLNAIYNVPSGLNASTVSQGVIEFGSGEYFNPTSLAYFAKNAGVQINPLDPKHIVGPEPPVGVEGTLDIQYIAGVGTGAVNWYWTEANWLYDWANSFFNAADTPQLVSISYGWAEYDQCDISNECSQLGVDSQGYVLKVNTEFQKIGVKGISLICASGDSGANGRTDPDCTDHVLHPDYPACSPYITSVGATQLNDPDTKLPNPPPICSQFQCASAGEETAVSYTIAMFTSGGGFSNYASRPSYQDSVVQTYLNSGTPLPPSTYFNSSGRAYPDVAALGHNFLIYDPTEGGFVAVGGTSASSPTFAGYMSFLNQVVVAKSGKPLGFLNPFLYQMYAAAPQAFRDITVGDNICTEDGCSASCKGYRCAKGWDPVTGLGVPDVQEMLTYVQNNF